LIHLVPFILTTRANSPAFSTFTQLLGNFSCCASLLHSFILFIFHRLCFLRECFWSDLRARPFYPISTPPCWLESKAFPLVKLPPPPVRPPPKLRFVPPQGRGVPAPPPLEVVSNRRLFGEFLLSRFLLLRRSSREALASLSVLFFSFQLEGRPFSQAPSVPPFPLFQNWCCQSIPVDSQLFRRAISRATPHFEGATRPLLVRSLFAPGRGPSLNWAANAAWPPFAPCLPTVSGTFYQS